MMTLLATDQGAQATITLKTKSRILLWSKGLVLDENRQISQVVQIVNSNQQVLGLNVNEARAYHQRAQLKVKFQSIFRDLLSRQES